MVIPGEVPAAFDALLSDLLEEHQPATPTEQILVNEMAQSYWLTQRAVRFQNDCFTAEESIKNSSRFSFATKPPTNGLNSPANRRADYDKSHQT